MTRQCGFVVAMDIMPFVCTIGGQEDFAGEQRKHPMTPAAAMN